jgi:hypothetical protein
MVSTKRHASCQSRAISIPSDCRPVLAIASISGSIVRAATSALGRLRDRTTALGDFALRPLLAGTVCSPSSLPAAVGQPQAITPKDRCRARPRTHSLGQERLLVCGGFISVRRSGDSPLLGAIGLTSLRRDRAVAHRRRAKRPVILALDEPEQSTAYGADRAPVSARYPLRIRTGHPRDATLALAKGRVLRRLTIRGERLSSVRVARICALASSSWFFQSLIWLGCTSSGSRSSQLSGPRRGESPSARIRMPVAAEPAAPARHCCVYSIQHARTPTFE